LKIKKERQAKKANSENKNETQEYHNQRQFVRELLLYCEKRAATKQNSFSVKILKHMIELFTVK